MEDRPEIRLWQPGRQQPPRYERRRTSGFRPKFYASESLFFEISGGAPAAAVEPSLVDLQLVRRCRRPLWHPDQLRKLPFAASLPVALHTAGKPTMVPRKVIVFAAALMAQGCGATDRAALDAAVHLPPPAVRETMEPADLLRLARSKTKNAVCLADIADEMRRRGYTAEAELTEGLMAYQPRLTAHPLPKTRADVLRDEASALWVGGRVGDAVATERAAEDSALLEGRLWTVLDIAQSYEKYGLPDETARALVRARAAIVAGQRSRVDFHLLFRIFDWEVRIDRPEAAEATATATDIVLLLVETGRFSPYGTRPVEFLLRRGQIEPLRAALMRQSEKGHRAAFAYAAYVNARDGSIEAMQNDLRLADVAGEHDTSHGFAAVGLARRGDYMQALSLAQFVSPAKQIMGDRMTQEQVFGSIAILAEENGRSDIVSQALSHLDGLWLRRAIADVAMVRARRDGVNAAFPLLDLIDYPGCDLLRSLTDRPPAGLRDSTWSPF